MRKILLVICTAILVCGVLSVAFGRKERPSGLKLELAKLDDNGILHINQYNFNDTIKTYTLLILFVWKAKDTRSGHMDEVITQIAKEIGLKENLYPFGKIAVGLETEQALEDA